MNNRTMAGFAVVGGSSVSAVQSVTANALGDTTVDNTDPLNPIITSPKVGLVFIKKVTVAGAATSLISLNGLAGDTDGQYIIIGNLKNAGDGDVYLRPEGLNTNQKAIYAVTRYDGTAPGVPSFTPGQLTSLFIGVCGSNAADGTSFRLEFQAKRPTFGTYRTGHSQAEMNRAISGIDSVESSFYWADITTALTKMDIVSNAGNAFGIGSWAAIYKMPNAAG